MRNAIAVLLLLTLSCATVTPVPQPPVLEGPGGVISGVVTDVTGAVLPGVTITVVDASKTKRTVVSDAQGLWRVERLTPGEYAVTTDLAGFQPVTRRVAVTAEHGVTMTIPIDMSSVPETITVTAAAPGGGSMWTAGTVVDGINVITAPLDEPRSSHFQDHKFVDARNDPLTTFAIDVDRASYANVRRYLAEGTLPPKDAVRIEEMVNYFRWSYPQPAGDAAFSITTEVAGCPWNTRTRLVRIGIQGRDLDAWKMAANNLVFLIDVSGSMQSSERLPLVQSALHVLVDQLRAEDRVSVVVYAGSAGLVLPSTSGADKQTILDAIGSLRGGGSTAGGEGIELAYKIAQENFLAGGNNRVILATDGDFNVGVSDIPSLEKLIEEKRQSGVFLSVLGVGAGNDALMETLADKGNGNYAYLDSMQEAVKVFREELTGTLVTIAKDVKVQIEFDPALVASYRQIGYENRALANKDFADDAKDAGELGAGHSVTALFEIVPAAANSTGRIATVRLRYKEPQGETSIPLETSIVDEGTSAYAASPDMQFAAAIAQFGMLLRGSKDKGRASWDDVLQLARVARGADLDGTREEFVRIAESARLLNR